MTDFEAQLRKFAIYTPEELRLAPTADIFAGMQLKEIGRGMQARIFKIADKDWVVKEGRWDLDMSVLFGKSDIPLPAMLTQKFMNLFSFTFLPDEKEIKRQYRMYQTFMQYFGYFKKDDWYYHPNRELILNSQKLIRDTLPVYKNELEKFYKFKISDAITKVLDSEFRYHNYLPKEFLLYGESITPQNQKRNTYFIVQQFVRGKLMHDIPEEDLSDATLYQLIIMIYLILLMNMKDHLLPDTRPRYPAFQAHNWLTLTDNIMVSKKRLTFIDTRWFWDTKANLVQRGAFISSQIIRLCKFFINELLDDVAE